MSSSVRKREEGTLLGNSLALPSSPLLCGVLNMEKEIEDMITGNRWKQAYEVSELSNTCPLPIF